METPNNTSNEQASEQNQPSGGNNQESSQTTNSSRALTQTWQSIPQVLSVFMGYLKRILDSFAPRRKCPYCLASIKNEKHRQIGQAIIPQCVNCAKDLPSDFFKHKSQTIALVGGTDTAKSTFITVLTNQLLSNSMFLETLRISAGLLDSASKNSFNKKSDRLLYRNEILDPTDPKQETPPIIIRIINGRRGVKRVLYLSLFDTAGEEFYDLDKLTEQHPHIGNADALIFLIDPLNIKSIFKELVQAWQRKRSHIDMDIFRDGDYDTDYDIVYNVYEVFARNQRIDIQQKISIPTAFCISKIDLLDPIANIYMPEEVDNDLLDAEDILIETEQTSDDLFDFLNEKDARLVQIIQQHFREFRFFPVAPIGKIPKGDSIPDGLASRGIIHPLVWILQQIKFV